MPHYPRGLLIIALSLYLTAIALGLMVSTIMSTYYVPRLLLLGISNVTIKKGESISIFTSWMPINLAYSLNAMGVPAVPEVIVPSIINGTPVVVRGIEPGLINYYGMNATAGELSEGALVSYELTRKLHVRVGDELSLTSFKGINESLIITGVVKSVRYPQPNYEVITNITPPNA